MAVLKKSSAASYHFYHRDGTPQHRMPLADGTGERPTHMGDARKLGLLPSVSAILGLLAKPGLEKWKLKQVALASFRTVRTKDESDEYLAGRIIDEAFKQVDDAADLGTRIHAEIERFFTWDWAKTFEPHKDLKVYVAPVVNWMIEKDIRVQDPEVVVVNLAHGFAGTSDAPFKWKQGKGIGVVDFKSKKTKAGEPVESYDGQAMQIAAYAATYWGEENLKYCWGANVYISTTEPGRVDRVMYPPKMLMAEWEIFKILCATWRHLNQWDPRILPSDPQPAFFSGDAANIAVSITSEPVKSAGGKQSLPIPSQGAFDTAVIPNPLLLALVEAHGAGRTDVGCDGIDFLPPQDCEQIEVKGTKLKSIYAWYYLEARVGDSKIGRISLKGDATLEVQGWKRVCTAYAKNIEDTDAAAGKKRVSTDVGTNGLPPKPSESPTKSNPKVKTKKTEQLLEKAARVKEIAKERADRKKEIEKLALTAGSHKGVRIRDVPDDYLVRVATNKIKAPASDAQILGEYLAIPSVRKALKL